MWQQYHRPEWQSAQTQRVEVKRAETRKMYDGYSSQAAASSAAASSSGTPGAGLSLPPASIEEDMADFRSLTMTPMSFQPHRHIYYVLGRPVMVDRTFVFLALLRSIHSISTENAHLTSHPIIFLLTLSFTS